MWYYVFLFFSRKQIANFYPGFERKKKNKLRGGALYQIAT